MDELRNNPASEGAARATAAAVTALNGKVVGSVRHPLNTSDFSSFLLQTQALKAKVIGLANTSEWWKSLTMARCRQLDWNAPSKDAAESALIASGCAFSLRR